MSIKIFLNNYNNECFPGQKISGRIECVFNSKKKLSAIKVKFSGRSRTSWTETETYHDSTAKEDKTRTVEYYAEETHLNAEFNLERGGENFSLEAGKHDYPFSYTLPLQLPSSFEGSVGYIRYYIKATVNRPWKFDYKTKATLNVGPLVNLNLISGLRDPVNISDEKTMCSCWCNDSGALTFNISVPISGYIPGQEINIGSYIQNLTNVSAESVTFKISALYEYTTRYPSTSTKYESYTIATCVERGVGAHGEKSWTSTLLIPTNREYPNLRHCGIIKVYYKVKGRVILPFPHKNLKVGFPITIGTLAITGVDTAIPGPPLPDDQLSLPDDNTDKINLDLPPPYLSKGGDSGSAPNAPIDEALSYPTGATAPPPDVLSYLPSAGDSYPHLPPKRASTSDRYEKSDWLELNPKDTSASGRPLPGDAFMTT